MVQEDNTEHEDTNNLARSLDEIKETVTGRGIAKFCGPKGCICSRRYTDIICLNCGHIMFGRVRYACPKHTKVTFLIDITNCPLCKAYEYMLSEFTDNLKIIED